MKNILKFGFGLLIWIISLTPAFSQQAKVIPAAVFAQKINALPAPQLIDVRSPQEFAAGHLAKSRLINVQSADFQQKIATLDKTKPVFVYCAMGSRSRAAASRLVASGFTEVYDLQGGIQSWMRASLPVSR